jgi:hypothetical protein
MSSSYHFVIQQPDHLVTAELATLNPGPVLRGQVTVDAVRAKPARLGRTRQVRPGDAAALIAA